MISDIAIDTNGYLLAMLQDSRVINCGAVPAHTGPPGTGIEYLYIDDLGNLHVVYNNGRRSCLGIVRGPPGPQGVPGNSVGISAVHVNLHGQLTMRATDGTMHVTPESVFGPTGPRGPCGVPGSCTMTGATGAQGISVVDASIDDGSLYMTFGNGRVVNAGRVRGEMGHSVAGARVRSDGVLVLTLTNGTCFEADGNVRGPTGTGISSMRVAPDGSLVVAYTNNRVETVCADVRVATGPTGPALTGAPGVGIERMRLTGDGELSVYYTNGMSQKLGRVAGVGGRIHATCGRIAYKTPHGVDACSAVHNLVERYPFNSVTVADGVTLDPHAHTFTLAPGMYRVSYSVNMVLGNCMYKVFTAVRNAQTGTIVPDAHVNGTSTTFVLHVNACTAYELVYTIHTTHVHDFSEPSNLGLASACNGVSETHGFLFVESL